MPLHGPQPERQGKNMLFLALFGLEGCTPMPMTLNSPLYFQRLEVTLYTMRNWASSRSNASLHNWHVKEFLLISQCDLHNAIDDCFKLLQVSILRHGISVHIESIMYVVRMREPLCGLCKKTPDGRSDNFFLRTFQLSNHEMLSLNTKSISIQFFSHVQTETAKRISNCQLAIKVTDKTRDVFLNTSNSTKTRGFFYLAENSREKSGGHGPHLPDVLTGHPQKCFPGSRILEATHTQLNNHTYSLKLCSHLHR